MFTAPPGDYIAIGYAVTMLFALGALFYAVHREKQRLDTEEAQLQGLSL
jgi:hypothetical protein